jgi:arylsulfatase
MIQDGRLVRCLIGAAIALFAMGSPIAKAAPAETAPTATTGKPNIVVIWGDDVGFWNVGAYSRGISSGAEQEYVSLIETTASAF